MKKLLLFLLLCLVPLGVIGCGEEKTPVSTDFAFDLAEVFDVDEPFDFAGKKGILYYDDGSKEEYDLTESNLVGFSTATTGEKSAELVCRGVKKTFSYVVEYLAAPTKEILTGTRVSLNAVAVQNASVAVVGVVCEDDSEVLAISFTIRCTGPMDETTEFSVEREGWDVRVKYYSAYAKVVVFCRGGLAVTDKSDLLRVSVVGTADAKFSVRDVVMSDGKSDFDLPDVVEKNA
ncbi:MAG: hypothetical protein IJ735_03155 [Clostridia bacterium]|nr:hypothetical protein [Clostridia bacterium]